MAGGPSTVELAAAVADAGGFPFLAGAYLTPERLADDIAALRDRIGTTPFGVNVFAPSPNEAGMQEAAERYAATLDPWAELAGVDLGTPRYDDDHFAAKVEMLLEVAPPVVSFAFAWPPAEVVERLQRNGIEVWTTINSASEVPWALELGVDALVAQGVEAGGHRGGPVDLAPKADGQAAAEGSGTRELLTAVRALTDLPVIAAGGVADATQVRGLLEAGASAVACGTAYLCADEAGTAPVHRHELLTSSADTLLTRVFTGRTARSLMTTWTERHADAAPAAYPHVHHVTAPLRAHGKATGQAELTNLWAGTGYGACRALPAGEITRALLP